MTTPTKTDICLEARNITKIYPGTIALNHVDFQLHRGKVNVLIGENGAGKSTLMKIIAGVEQPTEGTILLNGEEVRFANTREAADQGIAIIHQELNLFPNLTVAQNIFMAREKTKYGMVDSKEQVKHTSEILKKLEQSIDPSTIVGDLRVGQQQIIEIAKTMVQKELHILIMDEPTSSLSGAEVRVLFKLIQELKQQGIAIVYISHRMEEIMEIGDHVTILRDGHIVANAEVNSIDLPWIVRNMVGHEGKKIIKSKSKKIGDKILEVTDLMLPGEPENILENISFSLRKGEVLGIFGLLGSGRTELLECLMGLHKGLKGGVEFEGRPIHPKSAAKQIELGFAHIPEDRQREGLVQTLSVEKNLTLSSLKNYAKWFHLEKKRTDSAVKKTINDFYIKVSNPKLPIGSLSGGNQQKVVIGKAVLTNPKILLLDEPTRGIDVSAKSDVFEIINNLAEQGLGVILVSSELNEIIGASDRVIVLSKGRLTGEFQAEEVTEESLMKAATTSATACAQEMKEVF
ncbi:sugar ABC transporter ATP-binding protein [Neobacillus sp. Marseille-QA0830]